MRTLCAALLALVLASEAARADKFQVLWDKFHLVEQVGRLELALDARDWETVASLFSDVVQLRVLRVRTAVTRDGLVERWKSLYMPEKTTFHMTANPVVDLDGDTAEVTASGTVWNRLRGTPGGDEWEVWGIFRYGFVREGGNWRIDAYTFIPQREEGNRRVATAGAFLLPGAIGTKTEPVFKSYTTEAFGEAFGGGD